jgi:hypothetical protein
VEYHTLIVGQGNCPLIPTTGLANPSGLAVTHVTSQFNSTTPLIENTCGTKPRKRNNSKENMIVQKVRMLNKRGWLLSSLEGAWDSLYSPWSIGTSVLITANHGHLQDSLIPPPQSFCMDIFEKAIALGVESSIIEQASRIGTENPHSRINPCSDSSAQNPSLIHRRDVSRTV